MSSSENSVTKLIEWNNSFSLADILSLLMLLATFITILLVFIQRHDAAKPIVVIQSQAKSQKINYGDMKALPEKAIQVGCFGNCLAKEVEIDCRAVLSAPKQSFKKLIFTNSSFAEVVEQNRKTLINTSANKLHYDVINNGETYSIINEVMHLVDIFMYAIFEISDTSKENLSSSDITQKLLFKVSYKDIHNKPYKTYIEVSTKVHAIEINYNVMFSLDCRTIGRRRYKKLLKDKQRVL